AVLLQVGPGRGRFGARQGCERPAPVTGREAIRDNRSMTEKATATPTDTETLLLVDGSSYLYRAYHALPDLRGPGGVPTGAIHGVVSMMKLLREQYPAAHGACVFDDKGKTFRDDLYADYKATRTAMPDDLALQTR